MSQSTHNIAIKGKDQTATAFQSIQARAIAAGNRIRKVIGGALAAAGAYLSFRSIVNGINELGSLSDMAAKAGVSVDALTRSATAFQVAGLNLPVETLAKSFQYLQKNTGKGGLDNFYGVLDAIRKIEDPAKRGAELVKNFGRAGTELMPLIDGGNEAIEKIKTLTSLMPGVSQAAADAGDAAADSLTVCGKGAQSLFLRAIGKIIGYWSDDFPGGVRAGALNAVNYVEWFLQRTWAKLTHWGTKAGLLFEQIGNMMFNGYSYEQAREELDRLMGIVDTEFEGKLADIDKAREDYKSKLAEMEVDDLANIFGDNTKKDREENKATEPAQTKPRVNNELILGESYKAMRLTMLGPETTELKKQTSLLQKIESNTKKTAEEVADYEGETYAETDVGA